MTPPEPRDLASRLLRRARRLAESARGATATLVPVARAGVDGLAAIPARRAADLVRSTLSQAGDVVASRLLALDETAALLAIVVERVVERHGHDAVLRVVLRRNLLLDGSLLALIEPVLRNDGAIDLAPERLARGRETMLHLLADLAALDAIVGDTVRPSPLDAVLDHFVELRGSPIESMLDGSASAAEQARVLLMSYGLFLESFLIRRLPQVVADAALPPRVALPNGS